MPPTASPENQPEFADAALQPDAETLRRIVEHSPDWIQIIDLDRKSRWMNRGGRAALEIEDLEEFAGRDWLTLWKGADRARARQAMAGAAAGRSGAFQGYFPTRTGNPRWWSVTLSPLSASNPAEFLVIARDITDTRQKEEAAARLGAVAASSADAIIGFDTEGCITAWNRAAEEMFGYTAQEAFGQSYTLIGAGEIHVAQHEIFRNVMLGQSTRRYETQRRRKDGALIDVSVTTSPLEIGGVIQGASAVLRDITEQTRVAEELRRRAAMIDALLQGTGSAIYIKDTQGCFLFANPVCLGILNKTLEEVLGYDETTILEPDIAKQIMSDDAAIMQSGVERVFEELVPVGGKLHTFLSVKNPLRDEAGNLLGIMGVSTDITERKEREAEIQDLNARLRRAMQETHHRIKNNLQVISALTEMQAADENQNVPASAMQRIGQHVRALAGIHDLLTHQIKADARNEMISTKEILDKLMLLLQSMLKERRITYRRVEDARLTMEQSSSFAMLISELVSNAVKHGRGAIELTLTRQPSELNLPEAPAPPLLRLEVCDDGPGFPPDFDPQSAASTGLELIDSLTRWDLRGEVFFENRAEGGSRVVVIFPGGE